MRLEIRLEPPGPEADRVFHEWLAAAGLTVAADGLVAVAPERCLAGLVALRRRCYDRELLVNVNFFGREDARHGSH
jgi:hypothetical protein